MTSHELKKAKVPGSVSHIPGTGILNARSNVGSPDAESAFSTSGVERELFCLVPMVSSSSRVWTAECNDCSFCADEALK